jgi:hypothetical protein
VLLAQIESAVCLLIFGFSLLRGSTPERVLAGALLAKPAAYQISEHVFSTSFHLGGVELVPMLLDVMLLGVIGATALHANRMYPLWLGGVQIIAVASHLVPAALVDPVTTANIIMERTSFGIQLVIMVLGLYHHMARERRLGRRYAQWTPGSGV